MSQSVSASAEASSSRRTPIRSLRQPALLNIATRNDAGGLEPPSHSDAVALRMAMDRKVQWRRKGEKWMDRLCEGTVDPEEFKRGVSFVYSRLMLLCPCTKLDTSPTKMWPTPLYTTFGRVNADPQAKYLEHHQYLETLHERHLNGHCSYPLCYNPPSAPYTSKPRISISVARRAIEQKEGNAEDGFCSRACKIRSRYLQDQMKEGTGLRGKNWQVEILEVGPETGRAEKSGKAVKARENGGRPQGVAVVEPELRRPQNGNGVSTNLVPGGSTQEDASPTNQLPTPPKAPLPNIEASSSPTNGQADTSLPSPSPKFIPKPLIKRPPPKIAPPAPTYPPQPQSKLDDLLAGLVIVERPTQAPPSPSTETASTPPPAPPVSLPAKPSSARASSSLISTPLKLATTLISASRLSGPVPQLAEDSDGESELSEWEMEMDGFGALGEEEKMLFEEMRKAREMVETG